MRFVSPWLFVVLADRSHTFSDCRKSEKTSRSFCFDLRTSIGIGRLAVFALAIFALALKLGNSLCVSPAENTGC